MCDYQKIETSYEVWDAIRTRHIDELKVFGFSPVPDGDYRGDHYEGYMTTEYRFKGSPYPLIGHEIKWRIDLEFPSERNDAQSTYWLCIPMKYNE